MRTGFEPARPKLCPIRSTTLATLPPHRDGLTGFVEGVVLYWQFCGFHGRFPSVGTWVLPGFVLPAVASGVLFGVVLGAFGVLGGRHAGKGGSRGATGWSLMGKRQAGLRN